MSELEPKPAPGGKHEATAFVIVGLLGIALLALAVAMLVLPPGVSFALVRRGLAEERWSWVGLGGGVAALWLVGLAVTVQKLRKRGRDGAGGE